MAQVVTVILATWEAEAGRSKVEYLPSKHEALSSNM
jgi:hypothetical protein